MSASLTRWTRRLTARLPGRRDAEVVRVRRLEKAARNMKRGAAIDGRRDIGPVGGEGGSTG